MRLIGPSSCALLVAGVVLAGGSLAAQRGPAPATLHMDPDVIALACAPSLVVEKPLASLQITGGQDSFKRLSYAPGDLVTLNAGSDNGIEVGQEFYTRRVQGERLKAVSPKSPGVLRTTGWIRVYAVDDTMSLATITHACETIDVGDYLEPFALPANPAVPSEVLPFERDNYGHILIGTDRRRSFAKGDFMVVDWGSTKGVTPGARFVVFRDKDQARNFLYDLGEAVAVDVRAETSTLRVTVSRDAFLAGDYVALRKPKQP